jgi:2-dehydro-3-deoxygluconokinase
MGGAEANVALSLAIQGDTAAYVSVVPDNRLGSRALQSLSMYGVDVSRVMREGDRLGTYFFESGASQRGNATLYDRMYSAISLVSHERFDWEKILTGVGTFYFSGITPAISPDLALACIEALEECRRRSITTICDLNYRGKLWNPATAQGVMRGLLPLVDVCIANDEDSRQALGIVHGTGSLACGSRRATHTSRSPGTSAPNSGAPLWPPACATWPASSAPSGWACSMMPRPLRAGRVPSMTFRCSRAWQRGTRSPRVSSMASLHALGPQELVDYAIAASVLKLTIRGDSNLVDEKEVAALAKSSDGGRRVSR